MLTYFCARGKSGVGSGVVPARSADRHRSIFALNQWAACSTAETMILDLSPIAPNEREDEAETEREDEAESERVLWGGIRSWRKH